jgi:hypothetical protein
LQDWWRNDDGDAEGNWAFVFALFLVLGFVIVRAVGIHANDFFTQAGEIVDRVIH